MSAAKAAAVEKAADEKATAANASAEKAAAEKAAAGMAATEVLLEDAPGATAEKTLIAKTVATAVEAADVEAPAKNGSAEEVSMLRLVHFMKTFDTIQKQAYLEMAANVDALASTKDAKAMASSDLWLDDKKSLIGEHVWL